jgi:hypothetical protein
MEKSKANQERGGNTAGALHSSTWGQPSRAPRQDEEAEENIGSANRAAGPADGSSSKQGISNRPAKDEHAFPASGESDSEARPDSVDKGPKQVGGNRGQV